MKKNKILGFACVSESGVQFRKRLGDLTSNTNKKRKVVIEKGNVLKGRKIPKGWKLPKGWRAELRKAPARSYMTYISPDNERFPSIAACYRYWLKNNRSEELPKGLPEGWRIVSHETDSRSWKTYVSPDNNKSCRSIKEIHRYLATLSHVNSSSSEEVECNIPQFDENDLLKSLEIVETFSEDARKSSINDSVKSRTKLWRARRHFEIVYDQVLKRKKSAVEAGDKAAAMFLDVAKRLSETHGLICDVSYANIEREHAAEMARDVDPVALLSQDALNSIDNAVRWLLKQKHSTLVCPTILRDSLEKLRSAIKDYKSLFL